MPRFLLPPNLHLTTVGFSTNRKLGGETLSWIERHSLLLSQILCIVVVFITAWPSLKSPRLEADDYRYLHQIQQVEHGQITVLEAMTVENRWDHLWFMQEDGRIRFFRPTVVLSYALDWKLWGAAYPLGLALSNVWIHLACALLVAFLLHRVVGAGICSILASALFAGLAAHAECIWYIAGRTDSLAALGFLAAFAFHISGRRWAALPFFALGFITKELVIVAPAVFFLFDRWITRRNLDGRLYLGYGILAAGVLGIKYSALGGEGSDFVYPYLIDPLSSEFIAHLWLQLRSYLGNLLAAEVTVPFADAQTVAFLHRPIIFSIGLLFFAVVAWVLRRDRRFWLFLSLGVLTWLPTSFVYLSERYLYLPSVAFVGVVALVGATRSVRWQRILGVMLAGYVVFQSAELFQRHAELAKQPGSVQEMVRQIQPIRDQVQPGDHLLLVNVPGQFVRAQFAQEVFRVILNDPDLQVDVLTMMPGQNGSPWQSGDSLPVMGAGAQVRRNTERQFTLRGRVFSPNTMACRVQEEGLKGFNWTSLKAGTKKSNSDVEVVVLEGDEMGATALSFTYSDALKDCKFLVWHADCSKLNEHPWERRKNAVVVLTPFNQLKQDEVQR